MTRGWTQHDYPGLSDYADRSDLRSLLEAPGADLAAAADLEPIRAEEILNSYLPVFVIAFLITILVTPLIRRIALKSQIVDWPDQSRKTHRTPIAYLGGVAVFLGLMGGIVASYFMTGYRPDLEMIPPNIIIAMALIMFTGLADDIFHWDPNLKIGGQFLAAAALALDEQIGGRVAAGLLHPIEGTLAQLLNMPDLDFTRLALIPGTGVIEFDLVYWTGAIIIAVFVLGGCNAANLIDGLDGLLTGSVAIMAAALLIIAVMVAVNPDPAVSGHLSGARVVLCFALLGACLGFLPHNFRPATIFLGDAGSLLLGFCVMVIVLLLGEMGRTHLVFAGLIVFGLPILDTTLAIIRRRMNGLPISAPDDDHLHHMLRRTRLGTVGAVFTLYAITALFALTAIMLVTLRARVVYAIVLVLGAFIVVIGIKAARRRLDARHADQIPPARGRQADLSPPEPNARPTDSSPPEEHPHSRSADFPPPESPRPAPEPRKKAVARRT